MKKSAILFGALLGLVSITANAQKTATATLNVKLHPVQSIMVSAGTAVDIIFDTKDHYANGTNTDVANHLSIYSTGGFAVSVKTNDETLKNKSEATIPLSDITILASEGSNPIEGSIIELNKVTLSKTEQDLITSTLGSIDTKFNVNYAAKGGENYINKYFNSENPTVYTTTVLYSITAK